MTQFVRRIPFRRFAIMTGLKPLFTRQAAASPELTLLQSPAVSEAALSGKRLRILPH